MFRPFALFLLTALFAPLHAQYAPAQAEWNSPIEPFRVVGNLYHVGAHDVSSYLFTTPAGHILLDTGFHETVPQIEANLKKLGFKLEDIRIVITSHAHYDHTGGVAEVKRRANARLLANPAEAPLFGRGGKGDFAFGDRFAYPPVTPDGPLKDGEPVTLGGFSLTPHFTPGHTRGCTSWSAAIRDAARSYNVVIACSMSAPGYKLVANPLYPNIVEDYESSFTKLRALPCDIFLSLHSWDFDLHRKREALAAGAKQNPFVDPAALGRFLDRTQATLRKQVAEQRAAKP